MAESNPQPDQINKEQEQEKQQQQQQQNLKYLEFMHIAALHALVCLSRLYDFAKENSGPLKPGVQTVEGTVKAVVGPVYEKFHGVPYDLLKFVDRKVCETMEHHVPCTVKEASSHVYTATRSVAGEVQRAGVVGTAKEVGRAVYAKAEPTAKAVYQKYEPVAENFAVSTWRTLNTKVPLFPQVAQVVVPTVANWTDKYNRVVCYSAEKGYSVSAYLPLVPTERIAKVFNEVPPSAAATAK